MKLLIPSSARKPRNQIYRSPSVDNKPNRPHISSISSQCQKTWPAKKPTKETNKTRCALIKTARPASNSLDDQPNSVAAPSVKRVLCLVPRTRKRFFHLFDSFLNFLRNPIQNSTLQPTQPQPCIQMPSPAPAGSQIDAASRRYPQTRPDSRRGRSQNSALPKCDRKQ